MTALVGAVGAVVEGRGGRLFLGRQEGFDLGRFINGSALPPSLLVQWRATLVRRGRELSSRGIPYVFIIPPDAASIHFEDLPDDYPGPYQTPGQVFLAAMGDIPGVRFVYPVEALRASRGGLEVYQRTDSHWTTFGSGVAYQEIMKVMATSIPCQIIPTSATRFTFRNSFGDLGSQCEPERRSEIPIVSFDGREPDRVLERHGAQRQTTTVTHMPDIPVGRVLAFRDSFMTDLSPYLARSFSDFLTMGTTTRVMLDAVDDWEPDVVISEVAERRLVAFETDHQTHSYDWLYLTDHSGDLGKSVLRALNLLAGGEPVAAADIMQKEEHNLLQNSVHAYSAAVIFEAAGDHAKAAPFAEAALTAAPDSIGALALAARCRLATGRLGEAVKVLSRAVEVAPWNGAIQELYIYSLIQDGQSAVASLVAETALRSIRDHANLWYWAAILREASGQFGEALIAVSSALQLDPNNLAYLDLSNRLHTRG
ncbi:tetratricopeptide repeat protein [Acidisoma silvae]|uniref:Tetratricopeptide repeat protein n=1 Tax=Acidisoma silvae TaxID=2802396 RepID=A0A963YN20_9PROT|nr:tetratricopeptide repeat protein [Acidisoma silvae]MCB8873612.1 tetratricopeptide repeat protein [Acidisoma silvae]